MYGYGYGTTRRRRQPKEKIWSVALLRQEILDDLKGVNYIHADSTQNEDSRKKSLLQEIDEEGKRELVVRVMDLAFGECRNKLYKYEAEVSPFDITRTDDFAVRADYVMRLRVPTETKDPVLEYVKDLTHWFIIHRVLEYWAKMHGLPEDAALWEGEADKELEKIEDAIKKGPNIVQVRPMHFG